MYAQSDRSNVANLVSAVMPSVIETVQREYGRRAQLPFSVAFSHSMQQPSAYAPQMSYGSQIYGQQPQFGGFATINPGFFGPVSQNPAVFGAALPGAHTNIGVTAARHIGLCALECAQRIATQVLQTLPVEYRQIVQPALSASLPTIIELVSREWSRLNPMSVHFGYNVRDRQNLEWIVYNIITTVVESIIHEHHSRLSQQFGIGGQTGINQPFGVNQQFGQQYGIGYGANLGMAFAGNPQQEQVLLSQSISAIVPTIVELVERERARLSVLGQTFSPESISFLTQQVFNHVQQLSPSNVVLAIIPAIVETICRQLIVQTQTPFTHQSVSQMVAPPSMGAFNIPAMV